MRTGENEPDIPAVMGKMMAAASAATVALVEAKYRGYPRKRRRIFLVHAREDIAEVRAAFKELKRIYKDCLRDL